MTDTSRAVLSLAFLLLVVGLGSAWLVWHGPPRDPVTISPGICQGCNVVLISIDSLRRDRMSVYNYARKTTPAIDEWAKGAAVFDNYFATAYLTPISEGSVHTGLYPEVNGMTSFRRPISRDVKTLAELLKTAGYRTGAFGTSPEFENFGAIRAGFSRGFDIYQFPLFRLGSGRTPDWNGIREFIAKQSKFFLWIGLGDVHAPFGARAKNLFADPKYNGPFANLKFFTNMQFYYDGMFYDPFNAAQAFRVISWRGTSAKMHLGDPKDFAGQKWPQKATPEDMKQISDLYDNGVAEADRETGELIDLLHQLKLMERTVVILQSEHGESLGEHGYVAHYDIHDESVHVPLIISSPGLAASRSDALFSGVDVLPTLLDHVKVARPQYELDGQNIFTPEGKPTAGRDRVFLTRTPLWESIIQASGENAIFDRFRQLDDQIGFKDHGVRTRDAKLIHRTARLAEEQFSCWKFVSGKKISRAEFEYYDLLKDPGENRPATSGPRDLMESLEKFKADMKARTRLTDVSPVVQDYQ